MDASIVTSLGLILLSPYYDYFNAGIAFINN